MNWAHLGAFLWLRWRLIVNQFRRAGAAGLVLSAIVTALAALGAAGALVLGFVIGLTVLRSSSPATVMLAWDGAIVAYLFFWFAGLMAEMQRTDAISLDRFLHLPVSPASAFVINYLGSSLSLSLILVLPGMIGLATGLVVSRGGGMLVLFPLVAAFFLMMTALAYQFRGWLAVMMQSPRRRQTVMAAVPLLFVLLAQLPTLWNSMGPGAEQRRETRAETRRMISQLDADLAAGRITPAEYGQRRRELAGRNPETNDEMTRLLNLVAPPGWLAYGAGSAAGGSQWPPLSAVFGMTLVGTLSLRRSYATTLRLYKGDYSRGRRWSWRTKTSATELPVNASPGIDRRRRSLIEARLPWASDQVSGVAAATLRAWMRRPEMKMTLLTPIVMVVVFSRALTGGGGGDAAWMRPLTTVGFAAFVLIIGLAGPAGNQFGYDRGGFRAFVLSPVPRRDVLLAKNLAVLPFAFGITGAVVALSQWFIPMPAHHVAGVLLQLIPIALLFCLAANLLSILSPLALKAGSGMPAPHQGIRSFAHLLFLLVSPAVLGLTMLPLAVDVLFTYKSWFAGFPAYPVLGVLQAIGILFLYLRVLDWQGNLLQRRERSILDVVGVKAD